MDALGTNDFNVLDYGAVGDDKTDNTEAFSACLKAVFEAGGGRMFIPDGVYRGRIVIPGTRKWITVEIAGESEPTPVWGTIGSFPYQENGAIIRCVAKNGPAVISASNQPGRGQTDANNAWQTLVSDVHDPDNLGIGEITYWVVLGAHGAVNQFVKNGGASIRCRRIGSAPAVSKSVGE